jgi:uncharacterized protein
MAPNYAVNLTADAGTTRAFRDRLVQPTSLPSITDTGEIVAMFYWDGTSDLVKDVDLVLAGQDGSIGSGNKLVTKAPVDGPDADTTATAFKAENGLLGNGMVGDAGVGKSYKRRKLETGAETQAGDGNGITGDDETSELIKSTWDSDIADPVTAPTPGVIPTI